MRGFTPREKKRNETAAIPEPIHTDVFLSGEEGYHTYRIPSVITALNGTLLAFCEGRKESGRDQSPTGMMLRRSDDDGATWEPVQTVVPAFPDAAMDSCSVVDHTTGTVWLIYDRWPQGFRGEQGAKAAERCVANGASWGLMTFGVNQTYPFNFRGACDDPIAYVKLMKLTSPRPRDNR